ncbi:hypothetical protein ABKV19_023341 [Rosa sericea]
MTVSPIRRESKSEKNPHYKLTERRRRKRKGRNLGQEVHTLFQFQPTRDPGGDDEPAFRAGFRVTDSVDAMSLGTKHINPTPTSCGEE